MIEQLNIGQILYEDEFDGIRLGVKVVSVAEDCQSFIGQRIFLKDISGRGEQMKVVGEYILVEAELEEVSALERNPKAQGVMTGFGDVVAIGDGVFISSSKHVKEGDRIKFNDMGFEQVPLWGRAFIKVPVTQIAVVFDSIEEYDKMKADGEKLLAEFKEKQRELEVRAKISDIGNGPIR